MPPNIDLMKRTVEGLSLFSWGSLDPVRKDTKHWALRIRGRYYHLVPEGKENRLALGPTYPPDHGEYSHSATIGQTDLSDTEIQQAGRVLLRLGESSVSANDGIVLTAEGVLKHWKDHCSYDIVIMNCQQFASDLCYKLSGKKLLWEPKSYGEAIGRINGDIMDVASSALPPGFSQAFWLLSRPNVWGIALAGKVLDVFL